MCVCSNRVGCCVLCVACCGVAAVDHASTSCTTACLLPSGRCASLAIDPRLAFSCSHLLPVFADVVWHFPCVLGCVCYCTSWCLLSSLLGLTIFGLPPATVCCSTSLAILLHASSHPRHVRAQLSRRQYTRLPHCPSLLLSLSYILSCTTSLFSRRRLHPDPIVGALSSTQPQPVSSCRRRVVHPASTSVFPLAIHHARCPSQTVPVARPLRH